MEQTKSDFDLTDFVNKNKNYARLMLAQRATIGKHFSWIKDKTKNENDNFFDTLDDREIFLHCFFEKLFNVQRVFEQFELILNCFIFPQSKRVLKKWNIKKTAVMEYHLENYYHRIYTFRESIFQLINFLYFLKIPEREVNRYKIEKKFIHTHQFYDERVKKILEEINELFKPMNDIRRQSVHYGSFRESGLTFLKILEYSGTNINKLDKRKSGHKEAKELLLSVFFILIATSHKLLKIFKRFFRIICLFANRVHQAYLLESKQKK